MQSCTTRQQLALSVILIVLLLIAVEFGYGGATIPDSWKYIRTIAGQEAVPSIHPAKELVFVHIPKNAGSTIESLGLEGNVKWGRLRLKGNKKVGEASPTPKLAKKFFFSGRCSKWHIPPYLLPDAYTSDMEVFCIVRDPWQRLVSEYMYLLKSFPKMWLVNNEGPNCTIQSFEAFLSRALDEIEAGDKCVANCHLMPQWDFVVNPDTGERTCHHVLTMGDDLPDRFNSLMAKFNVRPRMSTESKFNVAHDLCSEFTDLPIDRLFSNASLEMRWRRVLKDDLALISDSLKEARDNKTGR